MFGILRIKGERHHCSFSKMTYWVWGLCGVTLVSSLLLGLCHEGIKILNFCRFVLYTACMINQFIDQNLKRAKYKILEDGTYFGEIPRIRGVWANAKNLEECRQELSEVLEGWLLIKVHSHESVPGFSFDFHSRNLKHA